MSRQLDCSYIEMAIAAGGTLTVTSPIRGRHIFKAVMQWPGEEDIRSDISTTVDGCLSDLDAKLCDDAAKEQAL